MCWSRYSAGWWRSPWGVLSPCTWCTLCSWANSRRCNTRTAISSPPLPPPPLLLPQTPTNPSCWYCYVILIIWHTPASPVVTKMPSVTALFLQTVLCWKSPDFKGLIVFPFLILTQFDCSLTCSLFVCWQFLSYILTAVCFGSSGGTCRPQQHQPETAGKLADSKVLRKVKRQPSPHESFCALELQHYCVDTYEIVKFLFQHIYCTYSLS